MTPRHLEARRLAQKGIPVFPVNVKIPQYKDIGDRKWAETCDLAQIDAWWAAKDYNIGVRPIHFGWVAIDLDTYKPGGVSPEVLAKLPPTRTHGTPHGGQQIFYGTDQKFGNPKLAVNVDVRSYTGFVNWPPSIVDGVEYRVIDGRPAVPLPAEIAARLKERAEDAERVDCPDDGVDKDLAGARAYCATIAAGIFEHPGRYKLAATLARNYGLTDATGSALCREFELRTEPSGNSEHATSWEATQKHVRKHGQGSLGEGIAYQQPGCFDDVIPQEIGAYYQAKPEEATPSPYAWRGINEIITGEFPKPEWLIEGLVLRGHINLLYGQSELGKSLLALAAGVAVNSGTELLGRAVSRKLPVIAAWGEEIAGAIQDRLRTGICETPLLGTPPFAMTCADGADLTVAAVRDDGTVDFGRFASELAQQISKFGESFVILDHVGIVGCLNENFKLPVTVFIRQIGRMLHKTNSTLLLLAHPTAAGLRYGDTGGSGAWRASVRNTIIMTRTIPDDKEDLGRILDVRGNYGSTRIDCRLEYPNFNLLTTAPSPPSSLRLCVLDIIKDAEVPVPAATLATQLESAGFDPSWIRKGTPPKAIADLMRRHGDGSLWHPLMFNPQHPDE